MKRTIKINSMNLCDSAESSPLFYATLSFIHFRRAHSLNRTRHELRSMNDKRFRFNITFIVHVPVKNNVICSITDYAKTVNLHSPLFHTLSYLQLNCHPDNRTARHMYQPDCSVSQRVYKHFRARATSLSSNGCCKLFRESRLTVISSLDSQQRKHQTVACTLTSAHAYTQSQIHTNASASMVQWQ